MNVYEIVNPSDAVTIEADDPMIAAVAVILLGSGQLGLNDADGNMVLPVMPFEAMFVEWWERSGMIPLAEYVELKRLEIVTCLRASVIGDAACREAVLISCRAMGGDFQASLKLWNEKHRSSENDICGCAFELADALAESSAEEEAAEAAGETDGEA